MSKKPKEIAQGFNQQYGQTISNGSVKRILKELGYGYRKLSKQLATGAYANRNLQFEIITTLMLMMSLESPIISIDCKKKERPETEKLGGALGNLYREGKCYSQAPIKVYDHDYDYLSEGKVIPHGIYDLQANRGYISIGNSAETADFVVDNLRWWWTEYGIHHYPDARNLLLLCDAGGANSYRHYIFKDRLLALSSELGISFIVAHYPPYASKWNPIEHRLFCHVHTCPGQRPGEAMSGVVFSTYDIVKERIGAVATKTGLTVIVRLNLKEYQTGIKRGRPAVDKQKICTNNRIQRHQKIPDLNYRINP